MSRLPARPNLEHLKKQAKSLLHDAQRGDHLALQRLQPLASLSLHAEPRLSDAQHAIAREYGFSSWPELRQHVEAASQAASPADLLWTATCASDTDSVSQLIEQHPELKTQPAAQFPAETIVTQSFRAAVQRTDRPTIDVLLAAGADIHTKHRNWAGDVGMLDDCAPELAPYLMERGAQLSAFSAARLGMLGQLRELVAADPQIVHARGPNGKTALHLASTIEVAQFLLDSGTEIDALDLQHESTPAQHMIRVTQARHFPTDRQPIARYLISRGCRSDVLMAAALGDLALVQKHVEADPQCLCISVTDAQFPKRDPRSGGTVYRFIFGPCKTPHQIARDFGHEEIFRYLMQQSPGDLKLAQACEIGDEKLFRAMLATRPNFVATLSEDERRRLPDAAQSNNASAVKLMLDAGWPVDTLGEYHMTALQWAAWHGNVEMVREILMHAPQLELRNNDHNITAVVCALHGSMNGWHRDSGDYGATVEALLGAGAKAPEVTDKLEASDAAREALVRHAAIT